MMTWWIVFIASCSKHGEEEAFKAVQTAGLHKGNPHFEADMIGTPQAMEPQSCRFHTTAMVCLASAIGQGSSNNQSGGGTPYAPSATRTAMSLLSAVSMCGSEGPAIRPLLQFLLKLLPAAGA